MTQAWFTGMSPASARVTCGSESHIVSWCDGRFRALAHPDSDLEAERALTALSGQRCLCLELRDTWERHAGDPRVLLLGPRFQDSRLAVEHEQLARGRRRLHPGPREPSAIDDESIRAVLDLDSPLPQLFVATVAAALSGQTDDVSLGPTLHAALFGRLLASIHRWTDLTPELELIMSAGERTLVRHGDERLTARLPFSWITEVWARRLDVVGGELTLAARPGAGGIMQLLTVDHTMTAHQRTIQNT